jgi:hypothetical protein
MVEDIKRRYNTLYDFGALFLWDVRLGKDQGETNMMSTQLGVISFLEEDLVIVSLVFHGALGTYVDTIVEYLGFEESHPRMKIYISRLAIELSCNVFV